MVVSIVCCKKIFDYRNTSCKLRANIYLKILFFLTSLQYKQQSAKSFLDIIIFQSLSIIRLSKTLEQNLLSVFFVLKICMITEFFISKPQNIPFFLNNFSAKAAVFIIFSAKITTYLAFSLSFSYSVISFKLIRVRKSII